MNKIYVNGHVPRKPLEAIIEQLAQAVASTGATPQVGVVDDLQPGEFPRKVVTAYGEILVYRSPIIQVGHVYVGPAQMLERFGILPEPTNQPTNQPDPAHEASQFSGGWWQFFKWLKGIWARL